MKDAEHHYGFPGDAVKDLEGVMRQDDEPHGRYRGRSPVVGHVLQTVENTIKGGNEPARRLRVALD